MAEPTLQLGGGNWAGKSGNTLGYYEQDGRFYKQDFTFLRSTTGTYTDKDGYIQEMPYNLFTYSNDFSNWGGTRTTRTSGQSGYDSSSDAWKLIPTTANNTHYVAQSISASGTITISVYAKSGGYNYFSMRDNTSYAKFDLDTGATTISGVGAISSTINLVTDNWYKCTFTYTKSVDGNVIFYINNTYSNADSYAGDGVSGVFMQNAQLVKGSSAKTYFPTTTRLDMPRVSYKDNSNGSLILEPQTQNLVTYSEDFSQWSTLSANAATYISDLVNPDGSVGGYKVSGDGIYLGIGLLTTTQRSIYARSVSGSGNVQLLSHNSNGGLATFTITEEWQRFDSNSSPFVAGNFYIDLRGASSTLSELYVWGAQATNDQSYVTSYIPSNSGSSVTRNADACTNGGDVSRFNSSEGVLFAEVAALADDATNRYISLSDGTPTNRVNIFFNSGNKLRGFVSGTSSIEGNVDIKSFNKCAYRYKSGENAFFINGVKVGEDTATISLSGLNEVAFDRWDGGDDFYGKVKQIQVYNEALSDSELATLTTL